LLPFIAIYHLSQGPRKLQQILSFLGFGILVFLRDITQAKKMEELATRSGRLAAMGEMAAKIAHEIRNPLGSIELFATMLRDDLQDFDDLKSLAEHICSGVRSINTIISNLLVFVRSDQQLDLQIIDIHDPIKDSLFFAEYLFDPQNGIEVITDFADYPLTINGDLELLKQVFLNLILNAIQAMPAGGKLNISTRKISVNQGTHLAEIRFSDTGCGIPQKNLARVFDPFFTTKKKGTGLGLTIVHNIAEMHAGSIDVTSAEADDTQFIVTLPLRPRDDSPLERIMQHSTYRVPKTFKSEV
jgi:signal transduction histidine kinase